MEVPSFRKVGLTIPLVAACGLDLEVKKVKRELRKLYVALGGDKAAECYVKAEILGLKKRIEEIVASNIETVFSELAETNSFLKKHFQSEGFGLSYHICYRFFSPESEKPQVVVEMEVGMIFLLHTMFLKNLKEERPRVYPLMRMIIHVLHRHYPTYSLVDAYEMLSDGWEMDRAEMENSGEAVDDEYPEEAAREEYEEFRKHVVSVKGSYRDIVKRIRRLHKKVSWDLSEDEGWFVTTAIQLFESWSKWERADIYVLEDDHDGDRSELRAFFNLLWDPSGPISDHMNNAFQYDYGNMMAPAIFLGVKNEGSLWKIKEVARSFILLECVMAGGEQIWT